MSGDLTVHRAFVYQLRSLMIPYINGPDTVYILPWSFMAEHEEAGIGGRELQMVEPCTVTEDRIHDPCLRIQDKQCPFQFCRVDGIKTRFPRVLPGDILFRRIIQFTGQERAIAVDTVDGSSHRQHADDTAPAVVDIYGEYGIGPLEEQLMSGRTDDFRIDGITLIRDLPDLQGVQVYGKHLPPWPFTVIVPPVPGCFFAFAPAKDHFIAHERIIVEIETLVVTTPSCQPDDVVSRIFVDPFVRHLLPARFHNR